jgi:hypothetical protein
MSEHATALLALWNDVSPELDAEYNEWHAIEHVPERLTVPGILWARRYRWVSGAEAPRYLTLYGLRSPDVLTSDAYQRLLREPTPMSRRMRPELRNISRWVCLLKQDDGTEAARLAVWTLPETSDVDAVLSTMEGIAGGRIIARRLADAAPLPWLRGGQGGGVEGQWLLCASMDGDSAPRTMAPACVYERLPLVPRRSSFDGSCKDFNE